MEGPGTYKPPPPRYRDQWPDVEHELGLPLPPVDYEVRIVREPSDKPPNWADRFIDICIEHQVTLAMLLWLVAIGLLTWWLVA